MSFWLGLLLGVGLTYAFMRADFYINLARGNIKLNRAYTKYEMMVVGNVIRTREERKRKKEE